MDALGRLFNVIPTADAAWVRGSEASEITFVCVGADTYTLQEATSAAGAGAQNLAVIDHYYTNTSAAGAAAWVRVAQAAGASFVLAVAAAVVSVSLKSGTDGFNYLRVSSSAAGLVYAVAHDLTVMRDPTKFAALAT